MAKRIKVSTSKKASPYASHQNSVSRPVTKGDEEDSAYLKQILHSFFNPPLKAQGGGNRQIKDCTPTGQSGREGGLYSPKGRIGGGGICSCSGTGKVE